MWKRRSRNNQSDPGPVGTEAVAVSNIEKNSKLFKYPEEGFATKIEHSLLYAMISQPDTYPEEAVKEMIADEDFRSYLVTNATPPSHPSADQEEEMEEQVSYAQLSAILALSAEKNPAQKDTTGKSSSSSSEPPPLSIPQVLCKTILKCIIKYAEEHNLDRETEVQELLEPVKRVAEDRGEKAGLIQDIPFYIGYTASLVTSNPIPLLVGAAVQYAARDKKMVEESKNVRSIDAQTSRAADVEKAGLLDEADDDW